jgi:outer membrane protein assembly factor BamB
MKQILILLLCLVSVVKAQDTAPKYGYLMSCSKKGLISLHDKSGEVLWSTKAKNTYSATILDNGNILYVQEGGIREVTPKKEVVLEFNEAGEIFCARRLKDGRTAFVNARNNELILLTNQGEIEKRLKLKGRKGHGAMRHFTITPQETFLVAHLGDRAVREYDQDGKILKEIKTPGMVYSVVRNKAGETYISWQHGIEKITGDGKQKTILKINEKSKPFVHFLTSLSLAGNGSIYVSSWLGHGKEGKGPSVLKLNKDGDIIWTLVNHDQIANASSFTPLTETMLNNFKKNQ